MITQKSSGRMRLMLSIVAVLSLVSPLVAADGVLVARGIGAREAPGDSAADRRLELEEQAFDKCVSFDVRDSCMTTIQQAIDAAEPGDKIKVKKGVYFENLVIPAGKDDLTLEGESDMKSVIDADAPNSGPGLTIMASNVRIRKLAIRNGQADGIIVSPGAVNTEFYRVAVLGAEGDCMDIDGPGTVVRRASLLGCGLQAIDADADDLELRDSELSQCGRGCFELAGDRGTVRKNRISVADDGECIDVDGDDVVIYDNELLGCAGDGVDVAGDNAEIAKNHIRVCDVEGIDVFGAHAWIEDNEIRGCDSGGVSVIGADPHVIGNNVSEIPGDDGFATGFEIDCDPCTYAEISRNKAEYIADDCVGFDIFAADPDGLLVYDNEAKYAGDAGFVISGAATSVIKNKAHGNGGDTGESGFEVFGTGHLLKDNESRGNHGDGIRIEGSDHILEGNKVEDNLEDGIDLLALRILLDDNRVKQNIGVGIEISLGSDDITLDRNESKDNHTDLCNDGATVVEIDNKIETTGPCVIDD